MAFRVFLVVEVDGQVVGMTGIRELSPNKPDVAQICRMFIDKKYRNMGIGTR